MGPNILEMDPSKLCGSHIILIWPVLISTDRRVCARKNVLENMLLEFLEK
jgi:hypothetical protein